MKILVTGSSGFIGSYLVRNLRIKGHNVYGTTKNKKKINKNKIFLNLKNKKSIKNINKLHKFDSIIHLGGIVDFSNKNNKAMNRVNINGTIEIAKVAKKMNSSLIFASTAIVHGKDTKKITIKSPIKLDTAYAKSKYIAEKKIKSFLSNVCVLRLSGVYGLTNSKSLPLNKVIKNTLKGKKLILKNSGNGKRNYIFILDLINLILDILKKKTKGTFLISSKYILSVKEMFNLINKTLSKKKKIVFKNPNDIIENKIVISNFYAKKETRFKSALKEIKNFKL